MVFPSLSPHNRLGSGSEALDGNQGDITHLDHLDHPEEAQGERGEDEEQREQGQHMGKQARALLTRGLVT